jgi:hypothetical protein
MTIFIEFNYTKNELDDILSKFRKNVNTKALSYVDLMAEKMYEFIYDADDYMYPKVGESDIEFQARMSRLDKKRAAQMTEEEKQKIANIGKTLDIEILKLISKK